MISRRHLLRGLGIGACSAAAHPWLTTVTLAGSAGTGGLPLGEHRLIVVILRGAMDGLDVVRPLGDAALARLRPTLLAERGLALGEGFYALHPGLAGLMPLWDRGELAFVHATSTPYRDKRSHFDGQDLLEAGTGMDVPLTQVRDGWMNRLLQAVPGLTSQTAFALGTEAMPLLAGPAPFLTWAPDERLPLSAQAQALLAAIYHDDPLFADASAQAIDLSRRYDAQALDDPDAPDQAAMPAPAGRGKDLAALAQYAAGHLRDQARLAAFSLGGWDSHRAQAQALKAPLARLQELVLTLQSGLGPAVWGQTLLLAMTEFGRTARENGSGGTDHGTAGAMVMAGGALRGGRVYGRFPGLGEGALYQDRDLMPTSDVRAWAGWALRGLYGLPAELIETTIFPGLDLGPDPGFLR